MKAAVFGADPNWGRILSTVGARAGSQDWPVDPFRARVTLQGVAVFGGGAPIEFDREALRARMRESRIDVLVELAEGEARAVAWGCDLSYDYVKINADYTSLVYQKADGGVAKDDRVSHYTPALKKALLVEALKYIAAFSGQIARDQVRRRRDGEGQPQGGLRRGRHAPQEGRAEADRRPRRRAPRSRGRSRSSASGASSSTACASPTRRASRSSRWSSPAR